MPSPLAGHAVNPSLEARWRHPSANGPASGEDTASDSWLAANRERVIASAATLLPIASLRHLPGTTRE
ncbi:hypothetical protein XAP6984_260076 [Xanthomonas phaseoli pv. phaseoli]|uniref:Uncharacterized protein n=1 Tax=Xanthomonas campestris pv. phaseoli TaxID=317013 RepID=A0ABY1TPJ9_XANCH|nr:hypothetical protein XAP6984_260076 [Xanthomonas phaseoli pv. phaseoli]